MRLGRAAGRASSTVSASSAPRVRLTTAPSERRQGAALDGLKVWPDRSPLSVLAAKAWESRRQRALRTEGG